MRHLLYVFVLLFCTCVVAQPNKAFKEGNSLYNAGKYTQAVDAYRRVLDADKHSAELYFNLANAHYKLNHIAPSIYYYEKALQLKPADADIKNNLLYSKNMTIDAIGVLPKTGFTRLIEAVTNTFSFDEWAKLSIVFVVLFVVLFLFYYFAYSTFKKRLLFITSSVSLLLMSTSLIFAFKKFNLDKSNKFAIVFAKEAKIKDEPNKRGAVILKVHEGTKVQVLEAINKWEKIKLTDGKVGWLLSDTIKQL